MVRARRRHRRPDAGRVVTRRVKVYITHPWHEPGQWRGWRCPACQIPHDSMWPDVAMTEAAEHWATCPALRLERLLDELGQLRLNLVHDGRTMHAGIAIHIADTALLRILIHNGAT
jgi:hypothetical protein